MRSVPVVQEPPLRLPWKRPSLQQWQRALSWPAHPWTSLLYHWPWGALVCKGWAQTPFSWRTFFMSVSCRAGRYHPVWYSQQCPAPLQDGLQVVKAGSAHYLNLGSPRQLVCHHVELVSAPHRPVKMGLYFRLTLSGMLLMAMGDVLMVGVVDAHAQQEFVNFSTIIYSS